MEGINDSYIDTAITILSSSIGVKNRVDSKMLESLLQEKKVKECVKEIAKSLGLPIEINLSYVPRGYQTGSTKIFDSTQLVKTDWRGRGNASSTPFLNKL